MNPFSDHNHFPRSIILHLGPVQSPFLPQKKKFSLKQLGSTLLTFVLLFAIFQLTLNWSAYRANLSFFWNQQITSDDALIPNKLPELGAVLPDQNDFTEPLQISVSPFDFRLVIPKIDQNIPIIETSEANLLAQNWNALEKQLQTDLQNGVVHYPKTALPGEPGNMVINGHSSYFPWDDGRFKDVFALLDKLIIGDTFTIFHDQQTFNFEVTDKRIIQATDVSILDQSGDQRVTLITCWPTGTNLKRLAIIGTPLI